MIYSDFDAPTQPHTDTQTQTETDTHKHVHTDTHVHISIIQHSMITFPLRQPNITL